jgi:hypothetical protein
VQEPSFLLSPKRRKKEARGNYNPLPQLAKARRLSSLKQKKDLRGTIARACLCRGSLLWLISANEKHPIYISRSPL